MNSVQVQIIHAFEMSLQIEIFGLDGILIGLGLEIPSSVHVWN